MHPGEGKFQAVPLTAELIEAFAGMYLSPRYDDARPTPQFHRDAWELYCSPHPRCMVIAPRDHAKSTALTFDYILAEVLFRNSEYVILTGSTEPLAQEQLSNIIEELHENEDIIRDFGPFTFETDAKTDVIVRCPDGHRFRIMARGAEQRIRGRMWNGKRPDLFVGDDMEDDEQVESLLRRKKFRRWFFRAAMQALSRKGKARIHGTILHDDSLLQRNRKNTQWQHLFYKAHRSFDDFSDILWPDRWSAAELKKKRQEFIDDNDSAGYSQEILNDPMDDSESYLSKDDFLPMTAEDHAAHKLVCAAWDFAVSTSDAANNSSCTVGGKDVRNLIHVIDNRTRKMNSLALVQEMVLVQKRHNPDAQFVEKGQIWEAIRHMAYNEMQKADVWINFIPIASTKDKATRGRTFQRRHRGGGMRFDKDASWYAAYEHELLRFTEGGKALEDDRFDSTALLCIGFEQMQDLVEEDFDTDEEVEMKQNDPRRSAVSGRNAVTGY